VEKLLIRPRDAAEILSISKSQVYVLVSSGQLPSVKLGRSVRIPYQALVAWVDREVGVNSSPEFYNPIPGRA